MTDARTTAPATCVFAVCPAGRAPDLAGVPGHAEATGRLRVLRAGPLDAVVQSVPAAAFSQEELRRRLSDPVALEVCARAHHEVVAAVAKSAPTVPLPLATLYFGDDRAADHARGLQVRAADVPAQHAAAHAASSHVTVPSAVKRSRSPSLTPSTTWHDEQSCWLNTA